MDNVLAIMFGCVLCTMTALNFMELRRIRKKLDSQQAPAQAAGRTATAA
jgi:hypothetical protein